MEQAGEVGSSALVLKRREATPTMATTPKEVKSLSEAIRDMAQREPGVRGVEGILTSQLGPDQVIATVGLEFDDDLRTPDIERIIAHLENELRKKHPDLFRVFVRPHPHQYQSEVRLLDGGPD